MPVVLGFDTSCYTTSVAAVNERGDAVASARRLLPVAEGERGLRQSEAVFAHVKQLPQVMDEAMAAVAAARERIVAVCASACPRDGEDSYMPVFAVGLGHARVLASALQAPLYFTSHQRGHIEAGRIGAPPLGDDFIAMHLSGGTTELLWHAGDELTLLGGSLDLHAGQLVDRVGVRMGLGFPAGAALERLAERGTARSALPVSLDADGLHCHLSGAEAQAMRMLDRDEATNEDVAAEIFDLMGRTVARMLAKAGEATGAAQALIVGGVASSALLRRIVAERLQKLRSPVRAVFGQPQYSADNAAGVAAIGMRRYLSERKER